MLGPIDENNQYSYAVISDDFCVSLFVISRNQTLPSDTVTEIKKYLISINFDVEKRWIDVDRTDCPAQP